MSLEDFLDSNTTTQQATQNNLVEITNKVIKLENSLKVYDELKKQYETAKEELKQAMQDNNVKSWTTPNNIKITLIEDTPEHEEEQVYVDEEMFIQNYKELHNQYVEARDKCKKTKIVQVKKKKGYVRISIPKENK